MYPVYLVLMGIALASMIGYVSQTLKHFYVRDTQQRLETHAKLFRALLHNSFPRAYQPEFEALCQTFGANLTSRITLILPSGLVIGDSHEDRARMDNHGDRPEIQAAFANRVGVSTRYSYTLKKEMMYVALPFVEAGQITGVVRAAMPVLTLDQTLTQMYAKIGLGGLIVALGAALISFFMVYRLNQPLEEIRQGAVQFARGELQHRIYTSGSQELQTLAETLNQMAAQLQERLGLITHQRNELETMLANMVEAVIVVDPDEHIVRCNQAAGKLFHLPEQTVKTRRIQEVIRNAEVHRFLKATLQSASAVEDLVVINGSSEQFLRAYGTRLQTPDGQIQGVLLVFHNITRLKQLENLRQEFVANVSHELRTPITSIQGFVETLQDGAIHDPENAAKFLTIIAHNANRLSKIIEDLLLLSKVEQDEDTGHVALVEENVTDVLRAALTACEQSARDKQITMTLDAPEPIAAMINADLLEQAVVNLLDNAVKYSEPHSAVQVRVAQQDHEVVISVADAGRGIPPEHLPRLFERFYRVDKARSRKLGGTGLGLAIVKHIAQAHQGTVTVESTVGKGSTFSIVLPCS